MKALAIVLLGLFCLVIVGMVAVQSVGLINKGIANKQFEMRGGRLLKRSKQPVQYWLHFALMCFIGGAALVAGLALLRMIGTVLLAD